MPGGSGGRLLLGGGDGGGAGGGALGTTAGVEASLGIVGMGCAPIWSAPLGVGTGLPAGSPTLPPGMVSG
jgi:hypothetical protein